MTKKKDTPAAIEIVKKPRKKNPPRTAFRKGGPNPHAFKPGENNPGGKPKVGNDLLSRSLRIALADRCSDELCRAVGAPRHSSFSQVLASRLLHLAMRGDLGAMKEIREATEGSHSRVDVRGLLDQDISDVPVIELRFIDSDGDGHPAPGVTIDAVPTTPRALPDASD